MKEAIYKFNVDCGRRGELSGIFVSTDELIQNAIGKTMYFYEVLGKHSEFEVVLDVHHLSEVTDNQEFISIFKEHDMGTGNNPLDYIQDEEDELDFVEK